jgi:deoxyribodipyrimidine photo-lyase
MDILPEPSRSAGLDRMAAFIAQSLRHYSKSRNFDFGPKRRSNISLLSSYLRHRLVLEQELLEATLKRHSLISANKFVQEVFWRAYFKGWLEHRPDVWLDYRANVAQLIKSFDSEPELLQRYSAAAGGQTGIDCFDAWVDELKQTGFLHNHARMWFASIWIFTLRLPWQLGADLFLRHLIDGDPASNTLSWRWVAGLHTKGKTYLALSSNIARYTDNRFNPKDKLATSARAVTESRVFPARDLPVPQTLPTNEDYGLLITEEDCCSETMALQGKPRVVLGAVATQRRSPLPVGKLAREFATGAVTDALRRATQHYAVDGQLAETEDWANVLAEWAAKHRVGTIVTAYAPVGPVAELLETTGSHLQKHGIRLLQLRRSYDSATWPHAKRGYFKLKDKIPGILEHLGLELEDESQDSHSETV